MTMVVHVCECKDRHVELDEDRNILTIHLDYEVLVSYMLTDWICLKKICLGVTEEDEDAQVCIQTQFSGENKTLEIL